MASKRYSASTERMLAIVERQMTGKPPAFGGSGVEPIVEALIEHCGTCDCCAVTAYIAERAQR